MEVNNSLHSCKSIHNFYWTERRTRWQLDVAERLQRLWREASGAAEAAAGQWFDSFAGAAWTAGVASARHIGADLLKALGQAVGVASHEADLLVEDAGRLRQRVLDGYEDNAFFAKTLYEVWCTGFYRVLLFFFLGNVSFYSHLICLDHLLSGFLFFLLSFSYFFRIFIVEPSEQILLLISMWWYLQL